MRARCVRSTYLQDSIHGVVEVLADVGAQALLGRVCDQGAVIELSYPHVCLTEDHLYQIYGALEEGPLRIHLPQICPLALRSKHVIMMQALTVVLAKWKALQPHTSIRLPFSAAC